MSKQRKTVASTYLYDPLDRLAASNSIQRFYNDTRIATEIEGERKSRFFETDSQPLALQQHGSLPGTTLLATDQQASVLNGVSPEGALHAQAYSPFGHLPIGALLNGAGFNGERPEPQTGHYLLGQGYRAFNPILMRFNSPDSWSPFGDGGINAYAYCDNDPLNKVDPTGHIPNIWKGLKNLFGRVPKRLRPSKVAATSAPSIQPVSSTIGRPSQLRPLPRGMFRRPNFNTEIPQTINHDVTRQATKNTVALMSTLAVEKPAVSLQVFTAKALPKSSMLELTPNDKLIFGDALRQNQLPEFNQQLNNLANTRERQKFLTALPWDNPTMYEALPQTIINTIRGG